MKRVLCLTLSLWLCAAALAGCGKKEQAAGLYGTASGVPEDSVLLSVDGRDVTAGRYFYWLTYNCDYIDQECDRDGTAPDWNGAFSGGTLGSYVKGQALRTTALYATVENWAERYGCTLTESEQSAIDKDWTAAAERAGGEEEYLAQLAWMGLDKAAARQLSEDYYLYQHLCTLSGQKGSALYPDQTALSNWAKESGLLTVDAIVLSASNADEAAYAQKKQRAQEIAAALAAAADLPAAFETAAASDSDDRETWPAGGRTFAPDDASVPAAVASAAAALGENQLSGVVEADGDLYLVLRKPLDSAAAADAYFDHLLQAAADGAKITLSDAYSSVDAETFYRKLSDEREKMDGSNSVFAPQQSTDTAPDSSADTAAAASASAK